MNKKQLEYFIATDKNNLLKTSENQFIYFLKKIYCKIKNKF